MSFVAGSLGREFKNRNEAALRQRLLQEQRAERDRRERRAVADGKAAEMMDLAVSVLTSTEVAEFSVELDTYDTATVEALQENERQLDFVRERIEALLSKAYILPDGRRVFKTEDGLRVFDEHGLELDAETIDPDVIPEQHPRWEAYKPEFDRFQELERERTRLLEYQSELDDAREQLNSGEMTREEYDELRDHLKDTMPEAVRAHVPGLTNDEPLQERQVALPQPVEVLDIADDMIPSTALAPKPM